MNFYRRFLAAILVVMLTFSVGSTAFATESSDSEKKEEELTEEEKAEKAALEAAYAMPIESNDWANWPEGPGTYGEGAIVMEVGTGAILYAKNMDGQEYPASITKVLTALVALENGQLTDTVTFSHDSVAFLQPGDSSVGLKEGNQITLEQALYATLLASANEAAYAVGESVGINAGHDYNWFLEQMNARCKELGGVNSNFANTNGLHDANHYTCARDMALIGREIFKHPEFFEIVQTLEYKIPESSTTEEHVFQQKHRMLIPGNSNYYEYAIGGKTGYTSDALSTLITMADKDGMQLVCVVLRTHGVHVYPDTKNLLEYGFNNFSKIEVAQQDKPEEVQEFITEENNGYVVLPEGVEFADVEMEIVPDEDLSVGEVDVTASHEASIQYMYEGNPVGSARAVLSQSYLEANYDTGEEDEPEAVTPKADSEEKEGRSTRDKIILGTAAGVLLILVLLFIRAVIIRNRKKAKRRKSRRR